MGPNNYRRRYAAKCPTRIRLAGPKPKSTKELGVAYAMKLLSQMLPYHVITEKLMNKLCVSEVTAERWIAAARARWAANPSVTRESTREQLRSALGLAYVECMAKGAYGSAIRALREMALLEGLYAPNATGVMPGEEDTDSEDIGVRDPDRIRRRMEDLAKRFKPQIDDLAAGKATAKEVAGVIFAVPTKGPKA